MLQMTSGISAIDAQPIASALSEMPGPALPVTARYPEYEQPSAIDTEASSSCLHKNAAVLWQLAPQSFHHRRPWRNRITRAEAHAARDQHVGKRLVAVNCDLCATAGPRDVLKSIMLR